MYTHIHQVRTTTQGGTMKAWVLEEINKDLKRQELDKPSPGPGEVLVKVIAAGICHSDVGCIEGVIPLSIDPPLVLGHEVAGTVEEVGEGVTGFKVGDAVVQGAVVTDAPGITRNG